MSNAIAFRSPTIAGTTHVIMTALAAKHAELDARREQLSQQIASLNQELACLEGTIRLFSHSETTACALAPKSLPLVSVSEFKRSEIEDTALMVLRTASTPLTTAEVARAFCAKRNVFLRSLDFQKLSLLVVSILRRNEARGITQEVGRARRNAVLWTIASAGD